MKKTKTEKLEKMTQQEALDSIVVYVLEEERCNYVVYCEENELAPDDIQGKRQRRHIYAQALIASGRQFKVLNEGGAF